MVNRQTKFQTFFQNQTFHYNPGKIRVEALKFKNGQKLASLSQFQFTAYIW